MFPLPKVALPSIIFIDYTYHYISNDRSMNCQNVTDNLMNNTYYILINNI